MILLAAIVGISCTAIAQTTGNTEGVSIAPNVTPPHPSAMLDIQAADKGLLIPRVSLTSLTDVLTIPSPANSLLVYNAGTNIATGYYYFDSSSTSWKLLGGGGNGLWSQGSTGNFIYNSVNGEVGIKTGNVQPDADLEVRGESFRNSDPTVQPALLVNGTAVFYAGDASNDTRTFATRYIHIGEAYNTLPGGGGRWNEINCSATLDLNYHTGNDVRIGAGAQHNGVGANLRVWGNIYSVNGTTMVTSDSTLKENIVRLSKGTLDKLSLCNGYTYQYKKDPNHSSRCGIIAQEIELQFPALVEDMVIDDPKLGDAVTYKTVDYNGLTSVLLEAIKELKAIIDAQELRIQTLENN